jgi:hypothetical protein
VEEREQISAFAWELECLVERFGEEFDLPISAMVGVLTMKATQMTCSALYDDDDIDLDDFG